MTSHTVSLPNSACTGRPGGDAIHLLVAGAPWQVAALLPHLDAMNRRRNGGYYYIDFHASPELEGESVEEDLASNWIVGKWTQFELESRLAHPGLGYPATPVVSLHACPNMAARLVRGARECGRFAIGFLSVALPHTLRFGIQFALAPDDDLGHQRLGDLLGALGDLAERDGGEELFGCHTGGGRMETDAHLFGVFALHLERNATSVLDVGRTATPAIERVFGGCVTTVTNPTGWIASLGNTPSSGAELALGSAA